MVANIWETLNFLDSIAGLAILFITFYPIINAKRRKLVYAIISKPLPSDFDNPELYICYKQEKVEKLHIANVYIWNAGGKEITTDDVLSSGCLAIEPYDELNVLDYDIISCSHEQCEIVKSDNNKISFKCLAKNRYRHIGSRKNRFGYGLANIMAYNRACIASDYFGFGYFNHCADSQLPA